MKVDITLKGCTFEVQGHYYPAHESFDYLQPDESSSFDISAVYVGRHDVMEFLADSVLDSLQLKAIEQCES